MKHKKQKSPKGYYEDVLVKQVYDEKQSYCLVYGYDKIHVFICGQCGHQVSSYEAINAHFDSSESCGSYSEQDIDTGEAHCLSYGEDIIHHDAVYEIIYHEPEYTSIETTRIYLRRTSTEQREIVDKIIDW